MYVLYYYQRYKLKHAGINILRAINILLEKFFTCLKGYQLPQSTTNLRIQTHLHLQFENQQ